MMRYERSQRTDDLDESIALIREAAAITEAEDPGRESVLTNLAGALMARFSARGDPRDFAEASALLGTGGEGESG
jgi:hypothetical protein